MIRIAIITGLLLTAGANFIAAQNTYIQVSCEPGVFVFLDNEFKGKTTADLGGLIIENVTPGTRLIKVVKDGFEPQEDRITVKAGEIYAYKVRPFKAKTDIEQKQNDGKGKISADELYDKQGGGSGGTGLDLAGWNWNYIPRPNVPKGANGRVVFEIKVDDSGEIISIKTLERSVSLEAENACRKELEKLTFSKTGTNVPAISTGKITFIIRSN
jgi:hypothetical protein